jgi:hypothetical protein
MLAFFASLKNLAVFKAQFDAVEDMDMCSTRCYFLQGAAFLQEVVDTGARDFSRSEHR